MGLSSDSGSTAVPAAGNCAGLKYEIPGAGTFLRVCGAADMLLSVEVLEEIRDLRGYV